MAVWASDKFPLTWGWVDNDRACVPGRTFLFRLGGFSSFCSFSCPTALKIDAPLWALLFLTTLIGLLQQHPNCSVAQWYPRLMCHTPTHRRALTNTHAGLLQSIKLSKRERGIYAFQFICGCVDVVFMVKDKTSVSASQVGSCVDMCTSVFGLSSKTHWCKLNELSSPVHAVNSSNRLS